MDSLTDLGMEFWAWRAGRQPQGGDDVNRIERPAGWVPDFAPATVAADFDRLEALERRWRALAAGRDAPVSDQVDWHLVGSALARVRWELARYPLWRRNPRFYVDQTLGVLFEALLPPPPFGPERTAGLVALLASIPATLVHARSNLDEPAAELTDFTVRHLRIVSDQLAEVEAQLLPLIPGEDADRMRAAFREAADALVAYRDWLSGRDTVPYRPPGPDAARHFLGAIAVYPYAPDELLLISQVEADRARWLRLIESNSVDSGPEKPGPTPTKGRVVPEPPMLPDLATQLVAQDVGEQGLYDFLNREGLLTPAGGVGRYLFAPLPPYLAPLAHLGVTHDATGPSRLTADALCYVHEPVPELAFFDRLKAIDPRVGSFHEGVHAQQLARAWRHPNVLRRYFYDSGPIEGIAFYHEELVLRAGLFDDSPFMRRTTLELMEARAFRVGVDVRLALGDVGLAEAERWQQARLGRSAPADPDSDQIEGSVVNLAEMPLRALSYQVGKTQLVRLLSDARERLGDEFDLRALHDRLWDNGNVPLSLLRWELLDDRTDLDRALELAAS